MGNSLIRLINVFKRKIINKEVVIIYQNEYDSSSKEVKGIVTNIYYNGRNENNFEIDNSIFISSSNIVSIELL